VKKGVRRKGMEGERESVSEASGEGEKEGEGVRK